MTISQKDIKLLWGKAASMCSICKIMLTDQAKKDQNDFLFGEQAHIVAKNKDGPRGDSNLTPEERDTYSNLILLCANHHTIIDKDPSDYSIEELYKIKTNHEVWVQESLSGISLREKANEIIYADIIDSIVNNLKLYDFESWSSFALSNDQIRLPKKNLDNAFELYIKVSGVLFPGLYPELESSIINLVRTFLSTMNIFQFHATLEHNMYVEDKFYKIDSWDSERYEYLSNKHEKWINTYFDFFYEFVKSLNLFSDNVRKYINPMFFATYGKFIVVEGDLMRFSPKLYEYMEEEKDNISNRIDKLLESINTSKIN